MKKEIDILELFSGIGGFTKGFQEAGYTIKKHRFSEIDKHAIANYKYNFKNAESIGSVTDVSGSGLRADVITFGSPCQDFSLAGKRAGMGGARSSLITEAIRLISEIRPAVFIWENVKGTFSSNDGADFWAIIAAFANIGGYRLEWQLLNTSWFLPQNRERIYLVGHATGRSEPGVFPFGESDGLYFEPNENKEKVYENSLTLTAKGNNANVGSFIKVKQISDLLESGGKQPYQQNRVYSTDGDMTTLDSDPRKNILVKAVLTPGRQEKRQNGRRLKEDGEPAFTLGCQDVHGVMIGDLIRRLTEIENERLQGFPDDWTKFGDYDGVIKEIPKTQRYKLCGNAVTVAVVRAIAERLKIF